MTRRIPVEELLRFLELEESDLLLGLRAEGLFESDALEPAEAEELRVAAVLMRELGVNAAGVDVALHLRRRMRCLEERMQHVLRSLLAELDRR